MKKKKLLIPLAVLLVVFIVFIGYRHYNKPIVEDDIQDLSKLKETCSLYDMNVTFYPDQKKTDVIQQVTIKNNKGVDFNELYFHLYPNAFKTKETAPFPKQELTVAYPEGFSPGGINIEKIESETGPLNYEFEENETILKVILSETLKPKGELRLNIKYNNIIPPSYGRYGYGKNTYNLANWYPILAVYDENGWNKDPYYDIGDPFYSEVALYTVKIMAPEDFIIAASGSLVSKSQKDGITQWLFKTDLVRDFAWVASDKFDLVSANVGKTKITSYYLQKDKKMGKKALEFAKKAIKAYNKQFGVYPYADFNVAASDFYIGGMEYPNLIIIGEQLYNQEDILEYVIAHETAHQWWYGLVGNNEVKEAWLDEALTEYSTILYFENTYAKRIGKRAYEDFILNPYKFYELGNDPGPILRPLSGFSGWQEYSALVYSRGAIMLKELEHRIGRKTFHEALRLYYRQNKYKNATTADFINAINQATGTDWSDVIYEFLRSKEPLEKMLELSGQNDGRFFCVLSFSCGAIAGMDLLSHFKYKLQFAC